MTKDTYYFSHDNNARNDEKILELRAKLGWEAYGIYWALIECLSEATGYKLELNKITGLAYSYNIDITLLQKIIDTCFELNLLTKNTHYFWSKSLFRRMELKKEKFIKRSEAGKKGMKSRWGMESKDNNVITKNNNVITKKVKKTKLKETKLKKTILKEKTINDDDLKKPSLHSLLKNDFLIYYKDKRNVDYYWEAKDGKNFNLLINKLKFSIKSEGQNPEDETLIQDTFSVLLKNINDKWLLNNLSISLLNSKYNETIGKIKQTGGLTEKFNREFNEGLRAQK